MNQASQAFRRVVHDALLKARLPVGQFYDDLEEFFTATLSDEDSTEDIAAKAL